MHSEKKMWRADKEKWEPVLVACPNGLYPEKDADGISIFENSHFESKALAWEFLLLESEAWVCLSGNDVVRVENTLAQVRSEAAEAAKAYSIVKTKLQKDKGGKNV